jgi:hypothetical protein
MKNESFSKQTVSTSTYVTKEDFEKMFSPGPVQTKGLINLPDFLPNLVSNFERRHTSCAYFGLGSEKSKSKKGGA